MSSLTSKNWHYSQNREQNFEQFTQTVLFPFWQTVEEFTFTNRRGNHLAYVKICDANHDKAIFLVTGRIETYLRYKEVIYDLVNAGYDVYCLDHLGQGRSERIHEDTQRGHIETFHHYVEDIIDFFQQIVPVERYKNLFALAHSMGGGILAHSILKQLNAFKAVVFCAPMFGINIPLPKGIADTILNVAERYPMMRDYYALGTGKWRALPFALNRLTHSKTRYEFNLALLEANPELKMGGPTYHWVKECQAATEALQIEANRWSTPSLVLQAENELLVSNEAQRAFIAQCATPPQFVLVNKARHELLMEEDEIRVFVLDVILKFFDEHQN